VDDRTALRWARASGVDQRLEWTVKSDLLEKQNKSGGLFEWLGDLLED